MEYIVDFDIAAVFIFIIVIWFHYQRKNLPILQNKVYIAFIICALISTVGEIVATVFNGNVSNPVFSKFVWAGNVVSFFCTNSLPPLYTIYLASLVDLEDNYNVKKHKKFLFSVIIPYIVVITLIILTPILYSQKGQIILFYVDENLCYHRGGIFFIIPYIVTLYCMGLSIGIILKNRKNLKAKKRIMVLSYIVIMIIAVFIQFQFPAYLVQCFGISLAAVMFSAIIQSPDEYLDRNTDLFNQAAMVKMLSKSFRYNNEILCISIILDDITFISNTFGIEKMNSFLQEVSLFLKKNFPHAYHYYLQPGKFCVIMTNYNTRDIERYVFELRARFHENWVSESLELKLYSRLCIMEAPSDVKSPEEILDLIEMVSDDGRYKQTTIYARDIDTEYKKRTVFISHLLRNALIENRFDVYYQPIYSVHEERLVGAEALIRLKDDKGKFVSPEEFIPIAEKTGDILRIGQFVFETVCKSFSKINLDEYGIKKIDINLSVAQCMQEILADTILTIRELHNVPSSLINLEITETVAAHTPDILLKNMRRLEKEGIELSLDDYGSGYSNMGYLLNLPFKMVKLDKNIVWAAFNDYKANIALAATISMINKLGMKVLAEGVETEEQMHWLISLGCDFLQGFHFARALPLNDYLDFMKKDMERYNLEQQQKDEYIRELKGEDLEELDELDEENNAFVEEITEDFITQTVEEVLKESGSLDDDGVMELDEVSEIEEISEIEELTDESEK
ncbi:MAG: EAL domain-containing protein [Treponema sp.]|nr:EAL domain-containing protein [Treponema sp.]